MDFATFFQQYGLILLLVVLLVFMFWSSRRRMQKQKAEQEQRARQTVPGAEVLLQGGLYGTIVSYDPDNLDQPAVVEIAPGTRIKVHSQSILRVVGSSETDVADQHIDVVAPDDISSISDQTPDRSAENDSTDPEGDADTKPKA